MKQTIQFIAEELGCTGTETVFDFYQKYQNRGAQVQVLAGMTHDLLCPGGYGVIIRDGKIVAVGDPHLETSEYSNPQQFPFDKFQKKVMQVYPMMLTRKKVRELGYTKTTIKAVGPKYQLECVA